MAETPLLLITGCTGFVGAWVTKVAYESGKFRVRGTTRNVESSRAKKLKSMFPDLELVACELTKDDGWEDAFKGVTHLMHTASPFNLKKMDFVSIAVAGTKRALDFASKAGVKNIVVTSSFAAVYFNTKISGRTLTGNDWSKPEEGATDYESSKFFAEKAAWKYAEADSKIVMNTINPGIILGPSLLGTAGGTLDTWKFFWNGGNYTVPANLPWCDVRDVAEAHLGAILLETSGQRFLIVEPVSIQKIFTGCVTEFEPLGATKKMPKAQFPPVIVNILIVIISVILTILRTILFFVNIPHPIPDSIQPFLCTSYRVDTTPVESLLKSGKMRDPRVAAVEMSWDFMKHGHLPMTDKVQAKLAEMSNQKAA